MALGKFDKYITSTDSGATVPSASVQVNIASSGLPASLFSDREGVTPIINPVAADINGRVVFYVAPNRFNMTATSGGFNVDYTDIVVVPGGAIAEQSSLLSTNVNVSQNESDISQLQSGKADTTVTDSLDQRVTAIESSGDGGELIDIPSNDVNNIPATSASEKITNYKVNASTVGAPLSYSGYIRSVTTSDPVQHSMELTYYPSDDGDLIDAYKWRKEGAIGWRRMGAPSKSRNHKSSTPTGSTVANVEWYEYTKDLTVTLSAGQTIDIADVRNSIPSTAYKSDFMAVIACAGSSGSITIEGITSFIGDNPPSGTGDIVVGFQGQATIIYNNIFGAHVYSLYMPGSFGVSRTSP